MFLFQDETQIRLFPPLRRAWSLQGEQAQVAVSGRNEQRALYGAINIKSGWRLMMDLARINAAGFQIFLNELRQQLKGRCIYMILDSASAHTAKASRNLAEKLRIRLIFLPKQCPELNVMDHLWRHAKRDVAANHQYPTAVAQAQAAIAYVQILEPENALQLAGVYSNKFWLKSLLK